MYELIVMAVAAIVAAITTTSLKAAAKLKLAKAELYSSEKELERAKIEAELKTKLAKIEQKKSLVAAVTIKRDTETALSSKEQQQKLIAGVLVFLLISGILVALYKARKTNNGNN